MIMNGQASGGDEEIPSQMVAALLAAFEGCGWQDSACIQLLPFLLERLSNAAQHQSSSQFQQIFAVQGQEVYFCHRLQKF